MRAQPLAAALAACSVSLFAAVPVPAMAQEVVSMGQQVRVLAGQRVDTVASFGGPVYVDGIVDHDIASFGGDIVLGPNARIGGDVVAIGGHIQGDPHAVVMGDVVGSGGQVNPWGFTRQPQVVFVPAQPMPMSQQPGSPMPVQPLASEPASHASEPSWFEEGMNYMVESLVAHGLLFLLALVLSGLFPQRMSALHIAIIREPFKSGALGLGRFLGAIVIAIALMITVLGIPLALMLGLAIPLATYVGLAACATVIGASLPVGALDGKPVMRLLAGVGVLWAASLVPVVGAVIVALVACVGVGALVRTRFRSDAPAELTSQAAAYR